MRGGVDGAGDVRQVLESCYLSTFASDQQDGSMPDADRICGLQDGSMTMLVYPVASDDEPAGEGLASDVCTSGGPGNALRSVQRG
jgi:hypothetical protein